MEYHDKRFIFENCLFETVDDPEVAQRVKERVLLGVALCRLKENGFMNPCNRCGGTGEHSFSPGFGRACFKCGGAKWTLPRITNKWKESVAAFDWRSKYGNPKVGAVV